MTWTEGTQLKPTRENTYTYRIRRAYRHQVHLGEGGFGITYLADCLGGEHKGEIVVIKTLLDRHLQDTRVKNDFFGEALKLQKCIHPHIVQIWDLFQESITPQKGHLLDPLLEEPPTISIEAPCLVQEYIEGETLEERLARKNQPLPEAEALRYIQHIASALAAIHQQGMVHRDVKPSNIMLRKPEYEAVLIDFGLVRSTNIKTHTALRTPGYAPPEQYKAQADRAETLDIYALAATLYTLVTGLDSTGASRLIESRSRGYELYLGQPDPLMRPEYWNPQISAQVSNAIWQGMELDPRKRPPTMTDWLGLMGLSLLDDREPSRQSVPVQRVSTSPFPPISITLSPTLPHDVDLETIQTQDIQDIIVTSQPTQSLTFTLAHKLEEPPVILEVLAIPSGSFWMGQPAVETKQLKREVGEDIYKNYLVRELPSHEVSIPTFWMARTPITQAQWSAVMGDNPTSLYHKKFVSPHQPVLGVSWDRAVQFCEALTQRFEDYHFRLPTEAEWEYACRAGTTTAFYFGDQITTDRANFDGQYTYNGSPKGKYREATTPVGQFPANAWGLQDMHGTVWEWCADQWYDSYERKPQKLKDNGSIPWTQEDTNTLPSINRARVLRGGSWDSFPRDCRSARRSWDGHSLALNVVGLRVVCVPKT